MTTAEQTAARKPTAKEIAENAEALAQQANTTVQQMIAELRDLRESGGLPDRPGVVSGVPKEAFDSLNNEFSELVNAVNLADERTGQKVAELTTETQKALKAHAQAIDANHKLAQEAASELAGKLSTWEGAQQALGGQVAELADQVRMFDEAGVAPANAEDVSALNNRLLDVERSLATQRETITNMVIRRREEAAPDGTVVPAVHGQVWQLMKRVTELGKDGQAEQKMGGYKFRSIEAAMTAVGHALREIGLMFVPGEILDKRVERYTTVGGEWKNGTRYDKTLYWTHVWVTQRYYFVSLIDGSKSEPFEMDGEARDNGDKSTSKADSMRMKYALLQALCIPTEGLPESDGRDGTEGYHDRDYGQPVGSGQQQSQDEPAWDDPAYQPGDAQHARSGSTPAAPADDRPDEVKAAAAVQKLNELSKLPPDQRRARFQAIADKVRDTGIGQVLVDGVTVNKHLMAANANLGAS